MKRRSEPPSGREVAPPQAATEGVYFRKSISPWNSLSLAVLASFAQFAVPEKCFAYSLARIFRPLHPASIRFIRRRRRGWRLAQRGSHSLSLAMLDSSLGEGASERRGVATISRKSQQRFSLPTKRAHTHARRRSGMSKRRLFFEKPSRAIWSLGRSTRRQLRSFLSEPPLRNGPASIRAACGG